MQIQTMYSLRTPQTATADIFISSRVHRPQHNINFRTCLPVTIQFQRRSRDLNFTYNVRRKSPFFHRTYAVSRNSESNTSAKSEDDFMTRILKENPSQVEPKYLVGNKFYTSAEREKLTRKSTDAGIIEILKKLNSTVISKMKGDEAGFETDAMKSDDVYLKDILREHKGKLYVPEQVFADNLSEEEQFDWDIENLPRMGLEEFEKALKNEKVKLLRFKESGLSLNNEFRDFVVELKEIPGDKSLHQTKWAMKLPQKQAETVLEEYKGARNEIEKQTMSWVGKLPEYPHPVATSLSSRMMVELGALTAAMVAAAAIVGGFLASAVFAVTAFVYAIAVYLLWPTVKQSLKVCSDLASSTLEKVGDNIMDFITDGWITTKFYEIYNSGGLSASMDTLKPMLAVLLLMIVVYRLTAARKQKNFSRWDLWQGLEFSQSKAQARVDGSTGVTFKDVAGIEGAVEELQELVTYLKNPELFDKMAIKPPHGVLLEGPPGCGKTLVAKAIAGEAGVPFYQMAGSEFVEILVGVGSARIRDLFKRAQVNSPSVIFIDEIDALATKRQGIFGGGGMYYDAGTQERETTLNQLLTELDGFDTSKGVIFLAATNRRDLLDPALLRPGRFDRKIKIRPPNAKGRLDILKVHASKVKLSDSVDLSTYAYNLSGWSGAKLAQLLQEAALVAVRKGHKYIIQSDVDQAVDRLTLGPKLVGLQLGHQGQCRRATVEVGTALTSNLLRRIENANVEVCDRISIIPHGQTLSQVVFKKMDNEDAYTFEREPQLLHRLQVFLGGRAAEEVIFGKDTSAASTKYLADASWLARKIISVWNLEKPLVIHGEHPPWGKKTKYVGPRLDFEGSLYACYMHTEPPLNFNLDDDVAIRTERLLAHMYQKTVSLLRRNHAALLKTTKVVLNKKEIRGDEVEYILDNYPANTPTSLILEESDPGSLPVLSKQDEEEQKSRDLAYSMSSQ